MQRLRAVVERLRLGELGGRMAAVVAVGVGAGVFLVAWNGDSLRLHISAANLVWVPLLAFGTAWTAGTDHVWHTGAGMVVGVVAAVTGFFGAMLVVPVTPFGMGIAMAVLAACVAAFCVSAERYVSLGGAAVGFAVGMAAVLDMPLGPTTSASDMAALLSAAILGLLMGVLGAIALRAVSVLAVRFRSERTDEIGAVRETRPRVGRPAAGRP